MSLIKKDQARGERLRVAREAKGLSQIQAAEQIGADAASISRYERGSRMTPNRLKALCDMYGVTEVSILAD